MMILYGFGLPADFGLLRHVQNWTLQRLISFNCTSGDVGWSMIALAVRSFAVALVFGQRQFVVLVRHLAGRIGRRRFRERYHRC
jgi:hypothetical protein